MATNTRTAYGLDPDRTTTISLFVMSVVVFVAMFSVLLNLHFVA